MRVRISIKRDPVGHGLAPRVAFFTKAGGEHPEGPNLHASTASRRSRRLFGGHHTIADAAGSAARSSIPFLRLCAGNRHETSAGSTMPRGRAETICPTT